MIIAATAAALAELERQRRDPGSDIVTSEIDDGRLYMEGTVDIGKIAQAVLDSVLLSDGK